MTSNRAELIKAYRQKVKAANKELTKKEHFKDLLNRLYADEKEIEKVIDKITGGAEATVLNIPRKDKLHRGSADTLYNKIIIEFENDLKVTLKHAKEQLSGYLLGQFNSGEGYNYTLCVLFGKKAHLLKGLPASGLDGKMFSGNLPAHNCNLNAASVKLTEEDVKWFYATQGKSSAFSTRKSKVQTKINPYKNDFKQGATIVPRTFFFVELTQKNPTDWDDRIINIKTAEAIQPDAKAPWKGLDFKGMIESRFVFRTALSKSILPFALYRPDLVVLPITIENNRMGNKEIKLHSPTELMRAGYLNASRWFQSVENVWAIHRTEKNQTISSENYLNWQNKLTDQNLNAPYLVLYNASAKDANATIVKRKNLDLEFLVESKGYSFVTTKLDEAYYLTAILNSTTPNLLMKDFQTKGLFGARDVHKKILDIYYPRFDKKDEIHLKLATLSKAAHEKVEKFLKESTQKEEATGIHLGKLRLEIKKHLSSEMKEIDKLVKKIIG